MEFKGTKGEWKKDIGYDELDKDFIRCIVYTNEVSIAPAEVFGKNVKECEANAKLIAAALDLLEASRGLVDYLLSDQCYSSKNPNIEPLIKAINKALK